MFTPEIINLRQLCRLEIPGTLLASVLFQELKKVIPCEAMTLLWRGQEPTAIRVLHESETEVNCGFADAQVFSRGSAVTPSERVAVLAPEHSLLQLIASQCPGVDEIVRQNFQTLAVYFMEDENQCGALLLHRPRMQAFATQEKAALARLSAELSSALSIETQPLQWVTSESSAGILLLDRGMQIQYACARGRKLMQFIQAPASTASGTQSDLAQRLRSHFGVEDNSRAANFVFHNFWGSFEFSLHRLSDAGIHSDPLIAVAVHRQEPLTLSVLRGCKKLTLTEKQTEIALLLVTGLSYDAVATRLGIRSTTVVDHVRKIYEKVGVANRSELVTMLLLGAKKTSNVLPFAATGDELPLPATPSYQASANSKGAMRGHSF